MRAGLELLAGEFLGDDRTFLGFHGHREKFLVFGLLPKPGNAGDGAAGTDTGDQDIHLALRVMPDFRAGSLFVNGRVGRVFELLRQEVALRLGRDNFFRSPNRAFHAFRTGGE